MDNAEFYGKLIQLQRFINNNSLLLDSFQRKILVKCLMQAKNSLNAFKPVVFDKECKAVAKVVKEKYCMTK